MSIWLDDECEEPEVDWSKVEVDTPIMVRNREDIEWERRYFANYEDGRICAWSEGRTSWTAKNRKLGWQYAKLAEAEE